MTDDRDRTPEAPGSDDLGDLTDLTAAGELDGLVDDVLAGRAQPAGADPEVLTSLHRVRALDQEPLPAATRDRHLVSIRTHGPVGVRRPSRRPRRRLVAVGTATALLVFGSGGAVAAAQAAQPDALLYGLKRTSEQVWLNVPRGSDGAAEVHLALAARRIDEARQAPEHAERLVAEGLENVEAAAEERPEEAIRSFERLLGDGADRLPDEASPVARAALHRNCVRIAGKHGLSADGCGAAPDVEHPGRGHGLGQGGGGRPDAPGQGRGQGLGQERGEGNARDGKAGDGPRGWGPGGRPDGAVGPPPGTPGHERDRGPDLDEADPDVQE
ncbi:hypothetical protein [Nitriliruptor alkaliphilus]|uniref:hypothetical protein n=1 Tax=Nitriliruptor alkaliphilus TaxID=427918 RepID=UPI000697E538|nr:hypothetical protein [Nitriliruptor alkaliphilus]